MNARRVPFTESECRIVSTLILHCDARVVKQNQSVCSSVVVLEACDSPEATRATGPCTNTSMVLAFRRDVARWRNEATDLDTLTIVPAFRWRFWEARLFWSD